jgi:methylenetetrahydrofolate--tRNA-(uracil-5-)-methyltransferase
MNSTTKPVHVIGAGMAGSEAAWALANAGVPVVLHEMRPIVKTDAHQTDGFAELVCSNSFRSDDAEQNAVGLLHEEMRRAGSLTMEAANIAKVPAGGALAVDRDSFSAYVTEKLTAHPLVAVERGEVAGLPPADWDSVIVATGPLTSPALGEAIASLTGAEELAFFDAIAPIVYRDSIDMSVCWFQSRYDKVGPGGTGKDYINCPLTREQYETFIRELIEGEKGDFKEWEKNTPYFEGCLPIEVMAERGVETLRFGPMKPVGLTNEHDPQVKPYAIIQLRQDNALGTLYNMVGFQTKLKHGEQTRVFRTIPGLEHAEFARLGGLHRNTFLNSPKLLDGSMRLKLAPRLRFAGQVTGVEGYVESAAMGLLAGRFAAAERQGRAPSMPPRTTALGALLAHITGDANAETFQPMNVNFGLFPEVEVGLDENGKRPRGKAKGPARKRAYTSRALLDLDAWLNPRAEAAE